MPLNLNTYNTSAYFKWKTYYLMGVVCFEGPYFQDQKGFPTTHASNIILQLGGKPSINGSVKHSDILIHSTSIAWSWILSFTTKNILSMVLATPFDLLLLTKKIAHSYCSRWFRNVVYHHNFGNKTYLTYNLALIPLLGKIFRFIAIGLFA